MDYEAASEIRDAIQSLERAIVAATQALIATQCLRQGVERPASESIVQAFMARPS